MKSDKGSVLIFSGLLLIAAALVLVGYNLISDRNAGEISAETIERLTEVKIEETAEEAVPSSEPSEDPNREMPVKNIDGYDYIGTLEIPSLEIKLPVMSEWDYDRLKISPCRYAGSVYKNNLVICAHNYDSHFGNIKTLQIGDEVKFTDTEGKLFCFSVKELEVLPPESIEEMTNGDWDLTLFTCTIGGATRVTVRCERVEA